LRGEGYEVLINPTGRFEIGGPNGDTGLTGRKIIVDSYGGSCPHGGGAFSGKDPSKVDRSAAYMGRYVAKNIVAAGTGKALYGSARLRHWCCLARLGVHRHARHRRRADRMLEAVVRVTFDLTPRGIVEELELCRPIYRNTAAYGHFGRELPEFTWERTDRAAALCDMLGAGR
jgi:S-adenosylmethionine synthetase